MSVKAGLISAGLMMCLGFMPAMKVYGTEALMQDTEIVEVTASEKYTTEDANLFEGASVESEILGVIKEGNPVQIIENGDTLSQINYLGTIGYIENRVLSDQFVSYTESEDNNQEVVVDGNMQADPLLPATHYVQNFGDSENMSALSYLMDQDYTDDYVYVCDSNNITISGMLLNTAYNNGCPGFTIIYTKDKMNPEVCFKLEAVDVGLDETFNLSFEYTDGVIKFKEPVNDLPFKIEVGIVKSGDDYILQNGNKLSETELSEDIQYYNMNSMDALTIVRNNTENTANVSNEVKKTKDYSWAVNIVMVVIAFGIVLIFVKIWRKKRKKHGQLKKRRRGAIHRNTTKNTNTKPNSDIIDR